MIPDITFELAKNNEEMYLFSPYDIEQVYGVPMSEISISEKYREMVDNKRIRKSKIKAREFFQILAEIQFESGYPYMMFEDTVNRANPIKGRINMSNLCSEILQVNAPTEYHEDLSYRRIGKDISCNLGSLNIAQVMDSPDFGKSIEIAIRGLTAVSEMSNIRSVPSIEKGNQESHAIGLGQMNLHGYLARERLFYGSEEALDFTNIYFYTVAYHAIRASNQLAIERPAISKASMNQIMLRVLSSANISSKAGSQKQQEYRHCLPMPVLPYQTNKIGSRYGNPLWNTVFIIRTYRRCHQQALFPISIIRHQVSTRLSLRLRSVKKAK